jgi:hypothetical protein
LDQRPERGVEIMFGVESAPDSGEATTGAEVRSPVMIV